MFQSIVIGHLGADAECGTSNGKSYVRFRVASSRKFTDRNGNVHDETQWFSCIMSGDGGQLLKYLKRGQCVCVIGNSSLSVVSSPKLRRMVAGADIQVANIELIGSAATLTSMPRQLATPDGLLHDVHKAYFIQTEELKPYFTEDVKCIQLYDARGNAYNLDQYGWVTPISVNGQENEESQGTNEGDV